MKLIPLTYPSREDMRKMRDPWADAPPEVRFRQKMVELSAMADQGQTISAYFGGVLIEVVTNPN